MRSSILSAAIVLAFAFSVSSVQAQTKIKFNPKVGLNVSALDVQLQDINADAQARAGYQAGLDLRVGDGIVFFNPGLHYTSFTARLISNLDEQPGELNPSEETMIQSFRLPVNAGVKLTGKGGIIGLHLKGGVTPAYVFNVRERPSYNFDIDQLNRFTLGANVGLGFDLLFLTVDANYEIGLNDFFKNAQGKNNMLSLSVGLKF